MFVRTLVWIAHPRDVFSASYTLSLLMLQIIMMVPLLFDIFQWSFNKSVDRSYSARFSSNLGRIYDEDRVFSNFKINSAKIAKMSIRIFRIYNN